MVLSICAALIIHSADIILTECPELKEEIESIKRGVVAQESRLEEIIYSKMCTCTSGKVKSSTASIGRLLRKNVESSFSKSPNGSHIVTTTLFTCMLPVVGFHVLSRTERTDVVDSFWLRLNNILHASGHLNYQQIYLFYGFF